MTREELINNYKIENHIRESYKLTIGENYLINKLLEAINYTPCCTEFPILPRCECINPDPTEIKVCVGCDGYVE